MWRHIIDEEIFWGPFGDLKISKRCYHEKVAENSANCEKTVQRNEEDFDSDRQFLSKAVSDTSCVYFVRRAMHFESSQGLFKLELFRCLQLPFVMVQRWETMPEILQFVTVVFKVSNS